MTESEMQQVKNWISRGGELLVGHNHLGGRKIKVRHGPFNFFTGRFDATDAEIQVLKDLIAEVNAGVSRELPSDLD